MCIYIIQPNTSHAAYIDYMHAALAELTLHTHAEKLIKIAASSSRKAS